MTRYVAAVLAGLLVMQASARVLESGPALALAYEEEVDRRLTRIPATLNIFIDRYGLLDADYEWAMPEGKNFWVLRPDREPTPWSGRYLVIVDSHRTRRPEWSRASLR